MILSLLVFQKEEREKMIIKSIKKWEAKAKILIMFEKLKFAILSTIIECLTRLSGKKWKTKAMDASIWLVLSSLEHFIWEHGTSLFRYFVCQSSTKSSRKKTPDTTSTSSELKNSPKVCPTKWKTIYIKTGTDKTSK